MALAKTSFGNESHRWKQIALPKARWNKAMSVCDWFMLPESLGQKSPNKKYTACCLRPVAVGLSTSRLGYSYQVMSPYCDGPRLGLQTMGFMGEFKRLMFHPTWQKRFIIHLIS